jgi:hypothetical protein
VEQSNQRKELFNIMNNNYGKGNMVDGILKLLLSKENLLNLDKSLVSLFTEISDFDMLVESIDHEESNPKMYVKSSNGQDTSTKGLKDTYKKAGQKLRNIRNLVKKSKQAMEREKGNLIKVHEIYTQKFQRRFNGSQTNLDEKSKRILMESLMNSQNKSLMNIQKKRVPDQKSADESEIKEVKSSQLEKSLSAASRKTQEVKRIIEKQTPEKREAIIKSLETRKKVLEM